MRLFMWEASDWMTVEPRFSIPGLPRKASTLWSQTALLSRSSGNPPKLDVNEPAHEIIFPSRWRTDDTLRRPPVWPSFKSLPDVPRLSPDLWAPPQNGGQEVNQPLYPHARTCTHLMLYLRFVVFYWSKVESNFHASRDDSRTLKTLELNRIGCWAPNTYVHLRN